VVYLDTTIFGISSSDIRERVRGGRSLRYLMPPEVEDFIREKGLYRGEGPL
jgi:nicotinate-nucleotide adenylyltransferase